MGKLLERLTPEQEAMLPAIRDEWIKIGLSCEPLDLPRAKRAVRQAYKAAGLPAPKLWFVADSPLSAAVMAAMLRAQVRAQVRDQVRDQVWAQVWAQVGDQVGAQVGDQVGAQVRDQVYGAHDAFWLAFYAAFRKFGLTKQTAALSGLMSLARHCGWWAPYRNLAILQHRHCEVHLVDGVLHRDGGPAVLYRDGFAVHSLHGVRVPDWLACEPSGAIEPAKIVDISNAEVRREFVRKVGLERIRYKLGGRLIHEHTVILHTPLQKKWPCKYRLEELSFGDRKRRVLVMDNPSLPDVQHVEYVPSECETVEQAMNFRLNRTEADVDDKDGSPWWLHGDVVIKPKGATTVKRWPERIA